MEYGKVLKRALDIMLTNKYLVFLGILVALGSGGSGGSSSKWTMSNDEPFGQPMPPAADMPSMPGMEQFAGAWVLIAVLVGMLILFALIIGFAILIVSSVARGGLVTSVETIETGGTSSFGEGWRAGWVKLWPLVGINVLPIIPLLLTMLLGIIVFAFSLGFRGLTDMSQLGNVMVGGSVALMIALFCILMPVTLILGMLRTFAVRACMLEQQGVWASYKRGWHVAIENLGPVIILGLLQIAISFALGLLMLGPAIFMALCCLLWPIFFLISGAINAYFSTVWTLAWREWTGVATAELAVTE